MNFDSHGFWGRILVLALTSCALIEQAGAQASAPASVVPTAQQSTSNSPSTPASASDTHPSQETLKAAHAAGYQVKIGKKGNSRFCKSESLVGTHFPTENCINEEQFLQIQATAQEERKSKQSGAKGGSTPGHE